MKKKVLLHICCAPCSASAVKMLREEYEISFYWHNPNIYDKEEHDKRRDAAKEYAESLNVNFFEEDSFVYDYDKWRAGAGENCGFCYDIRLSKAAEFAKNNGFDFFSTSLLSSPYQKHELIKQTGREHAKNNAVEFLYMDFRPAFYEGKNSLRREGYYIQKYCGCARSYKERFACDEKK
ncbi:MAG: epoxyqueuosine reductase QueH [Endomicrobia bacterium]|nr:epoxyqueuosine reductase QueH [Bacillota bacterium]MCL1972811.1 epoxyqueuosine reductase QueH [Endomicrobiia bacterium]